MGLVGRSLCRGRAALLPRTAAPAPNGVWSSRDMSKKATLKEAVMGKFSLVNLVSPRPRKEVKMCPAKPPKAPSASMGDYEHSDPQDLTHAEFQAVRAAKRAVLIDVSNPDERGTIPEGVVNVPALVFAEAFSTAMDPAEFKRR